MMLMEREIQIGEIYRCKTLPQSDWRVSEINGDIFILERTDRTSLTRFVDHAALCDDSRYVREDR